MVNSTIKWSNQQKCQHIEQQKSRQA